MVALIDEVLSGRAPAWKQLVELLYPEIDRLVRIAPSMQPLRDSEDHRFNVVADVLEKLQGKDKTYRGLTLSVAWRAEFPDLRLGNWLHTVVVRAASSYVSQLLGQHHVHITATAPVTCAQLAIEARSIDGQPLPSGADAVKLREVSVRYVKGEPWTPTPRPRHTFDAQHQRFELALPDRRAIRYVHLEYIPGRDATTLAVLGLRSAEWNPIGEAATRDKSAANKRLLNTLATELPADDRGAGFRPPVTDILTNQKLAEQALAWAAENLTPSQLRALLAWSEGASYVEIGRADVAEDLDDAALAKHGERLVRAARAKFDRKAKKEQG